MDLREVTSFADYFIICSGSNTRQNQAIADGIEKELAEIGERANSSEGYQTAEWVLLDYGDIVIHVMSTEARSFYDLERLWRAAKVVEIPPAPAGDLVS